MQPAAQKKWILLCFEPVRNDGLICFRILFGLIMAFHCVSSIADGSVFANYIQPPFTFNFIGFDFIQPIPGNGMYLFFGTMALVALLVMAGFFYRVSSIVLALMWTCIYLMQKSNYNNHHYLMVLLCWIMALLPAERALSIDSWRNSTIRSAFCTKWVYWLMMFQVAVVYFFAASSKLTEAWLSGKFIAIRFSRLAMHPSLGSVYGNHYFQMFISYAGIVFDFLIIPLLMWKKTRKFAILAAIVFHLFNSYTFRIGIFPYLSLALFLFFINYRFPDFLYDNKNGVRTATYFPAKKWVVYSLLVYMLVQLILPVRYKLFPGNVFWTEEGYRMSWKMMLRTKSGTIAFRVTDDASKQEWLIEPSKKFSPTHMMWLSGAPDIIWQYAQRLKKEFREKGYPAVKIFAISSVSMNRAPAIPLVNPDTDLASVSWSPWKHSQWIMPAP